ncbi:MAG: NADH-quinone oxidoreductase subunit L [Epsilonproteobacteria bacterium]|nr:MAG: NADH-quinone oxidoreductase subunit L [Campylobacterota bacterium]
MNSLNAIVLIPFFSALLLGLIYLVNPSKDRFSLYAGVGVLAPLLSAILVLMVGWDMMHQPEETVFHSKLFEWINLGEMDISVAFMVDRLSVVMLSFITFVGTAIHVYAVGYMKGDPGFGKFMSFFNLFMGSMLLLILADNPIIMFIGWELVGLCSYLLIGFYYKDPANVKAANKAFILNRIGDFGFIMALALLFLALEGNGYTFAAIEANLSMVDLSLLSLIGILLFVGAMGKSAQLPLYVWLPDAMAGPTPVSALIHAATMVTAGVYMVARFAFLYNEIPQVGEFIAIIGVTTALFAAVIAIYQNDIKKILAYSTMSQLGYMFVAVGLGAYSSGIFHVFTHAFFKALLFMGAGAVILALHHEQNIFKMGGLRKHLKLVYITMFIATLAISGIPPFAGFFSKDAILASAFASEHYVIWGIGTLTALLTAFYMFRMLFIVFFGDEDNKSKLEPLSKTITYPLVVLAFGSATAGFLGVNEAYGGDNLFSSFLALPDKALHLSHSSEYMLGALNVLMGLIGMGLAYKLFALNPKEPTGDSLWQRLAINKFYVDEVYEALLVQPLLQMSLFFDKVIDQKLFDGVVNYSVYGYRHAGSLFAQLQNGKVRYYALYIMIGVSMISLFMLTVIGGL